MNEERIKEIEEEIEKLKEEKDNWSEDDFVDQYDAMLNEQGEVKIGNLSYCPSRVLKEVDPIAYSCGLNDFADAPLTEKQNEIENQITMFESELMELREEAGENTPEVENAPEIEDYIISQGKNYSVGIVGGKFIGEFEDYETACLVIKREMQAHKFFPDVWLEDDHGGLTLITDEDWTT